MVSTPFNKNKKDYGDTNQQNGGHFMIQSECPTDISEGGTVQKETDINASQTDVTSHVIQNGGDHHIASTGYGFQNTETDSDVDDRPENAANWKEHKFEKQKICDTEKICFYFWRGIRVVTQIFLCVAVFVCVIVSKASFQYIANGIGKQKDIKLGRKYQHGTTLADVFVYQVVICLMTPDIFKLLQALWRVFVYRTHGSQGYQQDDINEQDDIMKMNKTKHWFKQNGHDVKHICLEYVQCIAMYTFGFAVFPILIPLEFCAFSAGLPFIPCMIRTLMSNKKSDSCFKKTFLDITYVVIYGLGFSGMAYVTECRILIFYNQSKLILTLVSMLLFGLRWIPVTKEHKKKEISNICHMIASLGRIIIAMVLTRSFFPDAAPFTYFLSNIKHDYQFPLNDEHLINQLNIESFLRAPNSTETMEKMTFHIPYKYYVPFLVCILTSFLCHYCAILACRLRMQKICFALPLTLACPFYITILFVVELCNTQEVGFVFCGHSTEENKIILYGSFVLLWTCHLWSCRNIWQKQKEHLPETHRLFNFPSYFGPFNDISLMNSRKQRPSLNKSCMHSEESKSLLITSCCNEDTNKMRPIIFVCVTMWHETLEEMKNLLTSILRLDHDHVFRHFDLLSPLDEAYDLEGHIFFDDALESINGNKKKLNSFVQTLHCAIKDVAREHYSETSWVQNVSEYETPYGLRKEWTLPGKNKLKVHFKDKELIRNKKRWSQVMYYNYILKHKVSEISKEENLDKENVENNIFILTVDGDVSFKPSDVRNLFIKMMDSPIIGAVTGRMIPCGSGPIIWFQKFEYAVAHWLWKTTEQVFGSVLCAPGCFSLYRGSALLKTGVLDTFSKIPSTPREYLQFDQGEDRWLCTLLLKEGYRVEYISHSTILTFAPEDLPEFLRQRRRWISSIMANLLDLQDCSKILRKRNTSISLFYVIYLFIITCMTAFTPAIVLWSIEISLFSLTSLDPWIIYFVTYGPFVIHFAVCFKVKSRDTQHSVTSILTIMYACVMIIICLGQISVFLHNGVSKYSFIYFLPYFVTALLHISEFYNLIHLGIFSILSPMAYILLYSYTVCNLNDISWGTRETKGSNKENNGNCIKNNESFLIIGDAFDSEQTEKMSFFKSLKTLIKIKLIQSIDTSEHNHKDKNDLINIQNQDIEGSLTEADTEESIAQQLASITDSEKKFWKNIIKEILQPIDIENSRKRSLMKDFNICRNKWIIGYVLLNCGIFLFRKGLDFLKIKLDITIFGLTFKPFAFLLYFIFELLILFQLLGLVIFKYNSFIDKMSRFANCKTYKSNGNFK